MDFTPDASRVLSDPAYMPERGQIYGVTNYAYGKRTGDDYDYTNALVQSFTIRSSALSQSFDYGVADYLSVRVNATYERENDLPIFGGTADAFSFHDPSFGVKVRALEQDEDVVNWDWFGAFAPSVIKAREPTITRDGTVARGGLQNTIGTAVSYKTKALTVYVTGEASYLGTSHVQVYNTIKSYAASWSYFFGLNTQTRLNDVFAVNIGINETVNDGTSARASNDQQEAATFDSNPGNRTSIDAAMVVHILPYSLAAVLAYDHDIYSKSFTTNTQPPNYAAAFDGSTRNEKANLISLSLLYVWD